MMKSFFLTALFAVLYFYVTVQTDKKCCQRTSLG